jgi:translation initiation factor 2B subunit (eIF-2B alpha/beta/delta family)
MKKSKKLIAMAILICLFSLVQTVKAQEAGPKMDPTKKEEMKKKAEELKVKLNLSEQQGKMYDEILKRNREQAKKQIMALPENAPRSDRGDIMKKSLANADIEILEILDSEQQLIYKTEKEKMKEKMIEKRKEAKKKK